MASMNGCGGSDDDKPDDVSVTSNFFDVTETSSGC